MPEGYSYYMITDLRNALSFTSKKFMFRCSYWDDESKWINTDQLFDHARRFSKEEVFSTWDMIKLDDIDKGE